jgi:hypothetical protein
MTFFSVAEATKHLGIDAKTLHRWLADAQLPLQSHPRDGRKKGVSEEQLQTLARLHHRSEASLSPQSPASTKSPVPPLPDALLALPQTLMALQAQVATLQQQVTDLTALLLRPVLPPPPPPTPAPPSSKVKRPPPSTSPVPRSRPAIPKTPPKPTHVIPRVEYSEDGHYTIICPKRGLLPFEPDTPEWFAWVAEQDSFRFVGKHGHFTAHHWWRVPRGAWRAHRQIRNHSHVLRLAPNHEMTIAHEMRNELEANEQSRKRVREA